MTVVVQRLVFITSNDEIRVRLTATVLFVIFFIG